MQMIMLSHSSSKMEKPRFIVIIRKRLTLKSSAIIKATFLSSLPLRKLIT